jgi:hypothetical protein
MGCSSHSYVEKENGTISVESEMWYRIKQMSNKAMQMCAYEQPDLLCVTMTVGEFSNDSTRIYKYDDAKKYKVKVRFYKSPNQNHISYAHDDSDHHFGTPNIRVGEYTGLLHNLIHSHNTINENDIVETSSTPFTFWNSVWLWCISPIEIHFSVRM